MYKQIDYSLIDKEKDPFFKGIEEVVPDLFDSTPRTGNCDKVPLVILSDFNPKNRVHEKQGEEIEIDLDSLFQGDSAASIRELGLHVR